MRAKTTQSARIIGWAPQGGQGFFYGDPFAHEANIDLLAGADFTKGCYIGQETVLPTKHRHLARKRVPPYRVAREPSALETRVMAGEIEIGVAGSHIGDRGLALIRLDKRADALATGTAPSAVDAALSFIVQQPAS